MPNTALLLIDLQNDYLADDGVRTALGWPPIWRLADTVTACAELARHARDAGFPVIYSRAGAPPEDDPGRNPRFRRLLEHRRVPEVAVAQRLWKRRIMDAVAPQNGDVVLDKSRPSFFSNAQLEPLLRELAVGRLIVAGLQTNVCVEATVRDGLARDFEVAVPEDAVSTDGPDLHRGALNSMRVLYVEIAAWRELVTPGAPWDRAFTTPDYGRDPGYWAEFGNR